MKPAARMTNRSWVKSTTTTSSSDDDCGCNERGYVNRFPRAVSEIAATAECLNLQFPFNECGIAAVVLSGQLWVIFTMSEPKSIATTSASRRTVG
jgi:hypothetical protein